MIKINEKTRRVSPIGVVNVKSDLKAHRLPFICKDQVTENVKLSECSLWINYKNGNVTDRYAVEDLQVNGDNVTFSWLLGGNATAYNGETQFTILAEQTENGKTSLAWNTVLASFKVEDAIEAEYTPRESQQDVFEQLLARLQSKLDANQGRENVGKVLTVGADGNVVPKEGGGGGGTSDYTDLDNKPSINGVTLTGNKTAQDLSLQSSGEYALKSEIPAVENTTGGSTDAAISQKAATDAINGITNVKTGRTPLDLSENVDVADIPNGAYDVTVAGLIIKTESGTTTDSIRCSVGDVVLKSGTYLLASCNDGFYCIPLNRTEPWGMWQLPPWQEVLNSIQNSITPISETLEHKAAALEAETFTSSISTLIVKNNKAHINTTDVITTLDISTRGRSGSIIYFPTNSHCTVMFKTGTTEPNITFTTEASTKVLYHGVPTFEANAYYEFDIVRKTIAGEDVVLVAGGAVTEASE